MRFETTARRLLAMLLCVILAAGCGGMTAWAEEASAEPAETQEITEPAEPEAAGPETVTDEVPGEQPTEEPAVEAADEALSEDDAPAAEIISDEPEEAAKEPPVEAQQAPVPLSGASEILAERVPGSEIGVGDSIVIVCDAQGSAVSLYASNTKLAEAEVTVQATASRTVLTGISAEAAVFEVLDAGDGLVYLRCDKGYLTTPEDGNALYYAEEPETCSSWQFQEDVFLYNPNAAYNGNHNQYLEFYNSYTVYGKRADKDQSPFTLSFYRIGNSDPAEELPEDTYYYLPVFETSDTHGYLANTSGDRPLYMLSFISDKVRDIRGYGDGSRRDLALLLDGGDIYQGNTMSNLMSGSSLSSAYQLMEYDAVTIGNHEFDWGIENTVDADGTMMDYTLDGQTGVNSVPVVCANLYLNGEKISFAEDYIILDKTAVDKDGHELPVRIAVIGFAGDYGSDIMYARFTGAGYSIEMDFDGINATAAALEAEGLCDATILLVHHEAAEIAPQLGEDTAIDLVLGGHTHQNACGVTDWGLPYIQPACYGAAYSYCELAFEPGDGAPVFQSVTKAKTVVTNGDTSRLTNTAANADDLDPAVTALTDTVLDALSDILGEEIGYITVDARRYEYLPGSGERATTCGNWVASIIARIAGADAAFVNNGGLRTDVLLNGDTGTRTVTLSDVYTMFPFDNRIYCYELTWEELLTALQYSLTDTGRTLLSQIVGVDCYYTDDETVQAIVTADGQAVYADGTWAEGWKDKTLRVAISEFIATTNRVSEGGMENPFCAWNDTERLIASDAVDNEGAYAVLSAEAAANEGHLFIDMTAHYVDGRYVPETPIPDDANVADAAKYLADGRPGDAADLLRKAVGLASDPQE